MTAPPSVNVNWRQNNKSFWEVFASHTLTSIFNRNIWVDCPRFSHTFRFQFRWPFAALPLSQPRIISSLTSATSQHIRGKSAKTKHSNHTFAHCDRHASGTDFSSKHQLSQNLIPAHMHACNINPYRRPVVGGKIPDQHLARRSVRQNRFQLWRAAPLGSQYPQTHITH